MVIWIKGELCMKTGYLPSAQIAALAFMSLLAAQICVAVVTLAIVTL
jgi:hypothetical protein